jgi:hypothetical protein
MHISIESTDTPYLNSSLPSIPLKNRQQTKYRHSSINYKPSIQIKNSPERLLFRDNSMREDARKKRKHVTYVRQLKNAINTNSHNLQAICSKRKLLNEISKKYRIPLHSDEIERYNEHELKALAERRVEYRKRMLSVITIKRCWRKHKALNRIYQMEMQQHNASVRLQKAWRIYYDRVVIPKKAIDKYHTCAALLVSISKKYKCIKSLKAYLARAKLTKNIEYFDEIIYREKSTAATLIVKIVSITKFCLKIKEIKGGHAELKLGRCMSEDVDKKHKQRIRKQTTIRPFGKQVMSDTKKSIESDKQNNFIIKLQKA